MPVFIRPARVIVEESSGGLAAVVVVAAAVALGAIAAVIDDIVVTLAIAAVVAVAGSLAVLIWVLQRGRGTVATEAPQLPVRTQVITGAARPAIEPRRVLAGYIISDRHRGMSALGPGGTGSDDPPENRRPPRKTAGARVGASPDLPRGTADSP